MKFIFLLLTFLMIDCNNSEEINSQEIDKKNLEKLNKEIVLMVKESSCSDDFICDFIGFGSKACGGSKSYLVFSNSIDVSRLLKKVKAYNEMEKEFNEKYGIFSDCSLVLPPTGISCENNKCKAIYSN